MSSRRVVNVSPILFLDRLGFLDQLNEPGVTVLVPDLVLEELGGLTPDDPAAVAVRFASRIRVVAAQPIPDSLRPFRLDRGEEAVLALALVPSEEATEGGRGHPLSGSRETSAARFVAAFRLRIGTSP